MITLPDILPLAEPDQFKVHFARFNGSDQPLDVLARSIEDWAGWQRWRPGRDEFNRPYVFAVAQDYRRPDNWLFGGIWEITERHDDHYEVRLTEIGRGLLARLVLRREHTSRGTRLNFENHYSQFEVVEVLQKPYSGLPFEGYDQINLRFSQLEGIVNRAQEDWRTALAHTKGVYLLTDDATGRQYVGSAYGNDGIWSRWCDYIASGHGGNVELRTLVPDATLDYCRENFRFSLLEAIAAKAPDELVIDRESHWKEVLRTRGETGLNRN